MSKKTKQIQYVCVYKEAAKINIQTIHLRKKR